MNFSDCTYPRGIWQKLKFVTGSLRVKPWRQVDRRGYRSTNDSPQVHATKTLELTQLRDEAKQIQDAVGRERRIAADAEK